MKNRRNFIAPQNLREALENMRRIVNSKEYKKRVVIKYEDHK